jgi:hypothetical protein
MKRAWLRPIVAGPLCALALGQMWGCSSPAGPPSPSCTRETLFDGRRFIPGSTQVFQTITTPRSGRLTVTVDWVVPDTIIRVVLAQAPCSQEQFRVNGCNVIVDLFPPPKPLEESTTWLAPGDYDLILGNFSADQEIASVNVNLSSAGCATP